LKITNFAPGGAKFAFTGLIAKAPEKINKKKNPVQKQAKIFFETKLTPKAIF
jgi:hypothetical protein